MKKGPDIFDDDLALEDLLKPKAEFCVSPAFKQRVMEEAKAMPMRRLRRWIPIAAYSTAASLAALVILALTLLRNPESPAEAPSVTASVEIPMLPSSDTIKKETSSSLFAESTLHLQHTPSAPGLTARKKSPSKGVTSQHSTRCEAPDEVHPLPVTEGEMPKTSREGPLDPNEVRTHLLETRRNAEIAYIEQMRDEIEANQAYIAQLMAEADVNQ